MSSKKVLFTYETTETVTTINVGSIEVPDGVEDVQNYIEENVANWDYEYCDREKYGELVDGPRDIEVMHAG